MEITIQNLQHDNGKIDAENKKLKQQIQELNSHIFNVSGDAVIEKTIMKQIILTYFTKTNKKDVLSLIASILVFLVFIIIRIWILKIRLQLDWLLDQ